MLSLGCKANARVFLSKTGHGPHSYIRPEEGKWFARCIVGVDCCYMPFWSVIVYHCHRVYTQLQLNIYHIISYHNYVPAGLASLILRKLEMIIHMAKYICTYGNTV